MEFFGKSSGRSMTYVGESSGATMAYVVKVKYENILRRFTLQINELPSMESSIAFGLLETRIRSLFQLPSTALLAVTYTDEENDFVTMSNDQDLHDALVQQALNPLRLQVTLVNPTTSPAPDTPVQSDAKKTAETDDLEALVKRLAAKLVSTPESVKCLIQPYERMFEGVTSPAQIPAAVENAFHAFASQLSSAVNLGTATVPVTSVLGASSPLMNARSQQPSDSPAESGSSVQVPVVHHEITCDGCGVNPIVGTRWKSNKKFDFDLCSSCFEKHGNGNDYYKIEHSVHYPDSVFYPHQFLEPRATSKMGRVPCHLVWNPPRSRGPSSFAAPSGPFSLGGRHNCYFGGGKLDARFVRDVTIFDGTEVASGTPFTKIWRVRNSGLIPWPARTSLVFVGGDDLGQLTAVPLEIREKGLVPEEEMDVSVDLVAPAKPGRYVSHWRLASPVGPKFGHRMCTHIQVIPREFVDRPAKTEVAGDIVKSATGDVVRTIPRELPAAVESSGKGEGSSRLEPTMSFVKVLDPIFVDDEESEVETTHVDDGKPEVETTHGDENELQKSAMKGFDLGEEFSIVDVKDVAVNGEETVANANTAVVEESTDSPALSAEVAEEPAVAVDAQEGPISYPVLDVTRDAGRVSYPIIDNEKPQVAVEDKLSSTIPNAELGKLAAMGFSDTKLNLELLEKNNLDLRKTLDDLCTVEEWASFLSELEEMGFHDAQKNRRLMFKNNGSVKLVVKELVQSYRDVQGKTVKVE